MDQIRIEPVFKTVHDIPSSKNETIAFLKKNYPAYFIANVSNSASRRIMKDIRRNSFIEPDWFYNVVALDFSPERTAGRPVLKEIVSEKVSTNHSEVDKLLVKYGDGKPLVNYGDGERLSNNTQNDQRATQTNNGKVQSSVINRNQTMKNSSEPSSNESFSDPSPSHAGQPPYHQNPIGQTSSGNETPPTNMFPQGRALKGNAVNNGPAKNKPKEKTAEHGSHEKIKSGENLQDENTYEKGSLSLMTTKKPSLFVPNDIFYAIEKRCANWSDDCKLNSANRMGLINQVGYSRLPLHVNRWPW